MHCDRSRGHTFLRKYRAAQEDTYKDSFIGYGEKFGNLFSEIIEL